MYSRVFRYFSLRTGLTFVICIALSALPNFPLLVSGAGQRQSETLVPEAKRRTGRPEGVLPDLEAIKNDWGVEREAPPPIPSTIRSLKNPLQPWNGRRVGDPGTQLGQAYGKHNNLVASNKHRTRLAHARRRMMAPPPLLDDQFVQNFFTWAVSRAANGSESAYWNDQLRVGFAQSQTSLKLAAIELGKTLFESAEYASRNRDNHWYVYDLYKTYLMRDPDSGGWAFWENYVPTMGRENVRRGFEDSGEFVTLLATITPNGSAGANASSLISARVDPVNQPGTGMLTRDASWSVPLLSLPGRAGLDLGLSLSYSSMVWTRSGPYIYFDEDNGFPSPGFHLGFPSVQRKVFDAQTAKNCFLLVTPAGQRVELRQVGTSNIYEAADSSYLQLIDNSSNLLVRSTDGTQLTFVEINNEFSCTQIKDRNGNYITVNHNTLGRITSITDTLGRVINFNYDSNANLISITQAWSGQPSHQWVSFGWSTRTMQYSFTTGNVIGTAAGATVPVITQVALNDTSYFTFDYTNSLQVSLIKNYFAATERNATSFNYETPSGDVPRLTSSSVSAQNWTGVNGVPAQVTMQYSVAGDGACVLTAPDGTIYKEYYGTGWQKGLTTLSEIWSGGVRQKWITTAWTQDNTSVSYQTNPRVVETNVYDASANRRRTVIDYGGNPMYVQYGLPYGVHEYAADGITEIRQTFTDYNLSQAYLDRRIIGLVSEVHLTNVTSWQGKISYGYDDPARLQALPASATQHDSAYNTSLTARGNMTSMSRWDFTDITNAAKALTTYTNYYDTGTPVSVTDPATHTSSISYADAFSDNINRNTFAYPTTMTDADGYSSSVQYNYDFSATTRTQSPAPAGQSQGAVQTMTYNSLGQLERVTSTNNGAYKRFWYGSNFVASYATVNNVADELYGVQVVDGLGRVIGVAANHPGSSGGYSLVSTIYDQMGRLWQQSNPTEINSSWLVSGDDAAAIYYTQQSYDWKGRPLVTTNPDSTTKTASYSGCGCAGGEVVTLTDEMGRRQKIYSDVVGRQWKKEILNWNGTVYSTTSQTLNARDQATLIRDWAGAENGGGTYQDTTMTYDGYGRLKTRHVPEQNAGAYNVWTYNADDTIQSVTDARGAATNFTYNNRRLTTNISWSVPAPSPTPIPTPAAVTIAYDAVGNRTSMTDGFGNVSYEYYSTSRLKSETRTLTGVTNPNSVDGKFKLSYDYNLAGQLKKFTDAANMTINYAYDAGGRVNGVTGSDTLYANVSTYASNFQYRAWGGLKSMIDGKGNTRSLTYSSRRLPTHFEVSGSIVSQNYDYYADGALSFVHNQSDNNFDRSYQYDHAARLAEVKTGGTARNGAGDTPFYESFGYDVFNNLTSRQTNTWNDQTMASDAASYLNNRRSSSGWSYDEDGRNLTIVSRSNRYDASGRQVQLNSSYVVLGHNINWTQNFGYDGIGARISESISSSATYYLSSTVMGAVVEELNGSGQKTAGYVYRPGGELLATQTSESGTNVVTWKHLTSFGTGEYSVNTANSTVGRVEFDPLHADVSITAPPDPPLIEGQGEVSPNRTGSNLSARFGDIFNTTAGCMIDGIPSTCDMAMGLRNRGAGDRVMKALVYNHGTRGIDWYGEVHEDGVAGFTFLEFRSATGGSTGGESVGGGSAPDTYTQVLGGTQNSSGTLYVGAALASTTGGLEPNYIQPQTTSLSPYLINRVKQELEESDCAKFAQTILNQLAPGKGRTLAGVFNEFLTQHKAHDLLTRVAPQGSWGEASPIGDINSSTAAIFARRVDVNQTKSDADNIIAELFHLARMGGLYTDKQLANAARRTEYASEAANYLAPSANVFDPGYKPGGWNEQNQYGYSVYFHTIQQQHCGFRQPQKWK